jgi:hypothetical protein
MPPEINVISFLSTITEPGFLDNIGVFFDTKKMMARIHFSVLCTIGAAACPSCKPNCQPFAVMKSPFTASRSLVWPSNRAF